MGFKKKCKVSAGQKSQLKRMSISDSEKGIPQGMSEDWARIQAEIECAGDRPIQEQEQVLIKALKWMYPSITP